MLISKNHFYIALFLGVILHQVGGCFSLSSDTSLMLSLNAIGLIVYCVSFLVLFRTQSIGSIINPRIRLLTILMIGYTLIMVSRGFLTYPILSGGLSPRNAYGAIAFLLPLIVFIDVHKIKLKQLIVGNTIMIIIAAAIILLSYPLMNFDIVGEYAYFEILAIVERPSLFLFSTSFFLFLFPFIANKYTKYLFLSMFILSTLLMMVFARRGWSFIHIVVLCIFFFQLYFKNAKYGLLKTVLLFVVLFFFMINLLDILSQFPLLSERLYENSREGVATSFFKSFNGDIFDWFFGRGIKGEYFCDEFDDSPTNYRDIIETGYLYLILKGGVLYLILFLLLGLSAFLRGFFMSKNRFTKGLALYILVNIIFLVPFGLPSFSYQYLLYWYSIFMCFNNDVLNMIDQDIKDNFVE